MAFFEYWHRMDEDYFTVEYGTDFSYPPHVHRCYEALLLLEGEMEVVVDGQSYRLRAGDAALIFPHQIHEMRTAQRSVHQLFIFSPELIAAFDRQHTQQLPLSPILRLADSPVQAMLRQLSESDNVYAAKGALYALCSLAEEQTTFAEGAVHRHGNVPLLRDILSYIQDNFRDECSLAALSKTVKYDMTYLSKFFTANVGISFTAYVTQVRITHACYLLRNTDRSVLDISHECGNLSLRTFNRNFLTLRGCTPSEYRVKNR